MYYNIADFSVLDFANGMEDLQRGQLRLIGEPHLRYREDPVRMLRAVRFMCKLGFTLDPACETPLWNMGASLHGVPAARLFEEVLKMFLSGNALNTFEKLRHYGLFAYLFPQTELCLASEEQQFPRTLINHGLAATDERIRANKQVSPAFLFAILLWEPVRLRQVALELEGFPPSAAAYQASSEVLLKQRRYVAAPKRFILQTREFWALQHRFEELRGKRPLRFLTHPRFRAAYDFLQLRAAAGEVEPKLATWWTQFQSVNSHEQELMLADFKGSTKLHRRKKKVA
jgi:poly(A) polymerase